MLTSESARIGQHAYRKQNFGILKIEQRDDDYEHHRKDKTKTPTVSAQLTQTIT